MRSIVIGTRASRLALVQVDEVRGLLAARQQDIAIETREISTAGDRDRTTTLAVLGGQGVFVKEIEAALLGGEIDLAVHSLKDMPSTLPPGLVIAAVPHRGDPLDAVYSPRGPLAGLPPGATVASSSPRRVAQLRRAYPALDIVDIRGNVDTRMRKIDEGHAAALIVAGAALDRLGLAGRRTETLPPSLMLPAPGQGALACEIRADDIELAGILAGIADPVATAEVTAERAFLRRFGTGCTLPLAALARVAAGRLTLEGLVVTPDGARAVRMTIDGRGEDAEQIGAELAERCLAAGADRLLELRTP